LSLFVPYGPTEQCVKLSFLESKNWIKVSGGTHNARVYVIISGEMKSDKRNVIIEQVMLNKSEERAYLLNLLTFYSRYCKQSGRYQIDKELEKKIKDLFGLIRAGKFSIDNAPIKFLNVIALAIIEYEREIEFIVEQNTIIKNRTADALDKYLKGIDGEDNDKFTPKEMMGYNLFYNKKIMSEHKFSPKLRAMVYQLIQSKVEKECKEGEKSKLLKATTNNFDIEFIAKIVDKNMLYRITKITKKI